VDPSSRREKLSVIIPAMNEAGGIRNLLASYVDGLRGAGIPFEIVVVNDVATDNTSEILSGMIAEYPEIRAFDRRGGAGYGSAIASGIGLCRGDFVVISSADGCNNTDDIIRYYQTLQEGYDAVFGSRFTAGSSITGYPPAKLVVNRLSNLLLQMLFGFKFNDYTDAFKGFRLELLNQCKPLFSPRFNITIELSLKAMLLTTNIKQVPTHWYGRTWGASKLSILKVLRHYLSTLLFVIGLRIVADDFRRTARSHIEIQPLQPAP
jgi:dolichol-phosphate mannosyltransferase